MTRDYKKEYKRDLETGKSGPNSAQHERQRGRRMLDKKGMTKMSGCRQRHRPQKTNTTRR
jgi:hypothetical protein